MKANTRCQQANRRAHPFNASRFQGKIRIVLGLCAVLGAGLISVQAANTPEPAAVRAADTSIQATTSEVREQKLIAPDRQQIPPSRATLRSPVLITPAGIERKPHRIYAVNETSAANIEV